MCGLRITFVQLNHPSKGTDAALIRKYVGEFSLDPICYRCSSCGQIFVSCSKKPYCYLCSLSHNLGDPRHCEHEKFVYPLLNKACWRWHSITNPHQLHQMKLTDHIENRSLQNHLEPNHNQDLTEIKIAVDPDQSQWLIQLLPVRLTR